MLPDFLPLRLRSLSLTSECFVFANLLIILASSLVMIALFRRLRLPPVLGYLCVGLMVGPTAFNWVNESEHLPDVAELGVVFLLFSLGLEFSLSKMIALRKVVFRLGSQQVLLSTGLLGLVLILLGMPLAPALLLGAGLSLSSTAIVTKELSSLGEVFSSHGQNAVGGLAVSGRGRGVAAYLGAGVRREQRASLVLGLAADAGEDRGAVFRSVAGQPLVAATAVP